MSKKLIEEEKLIELQNSLNENKHKRIIEELKFKRESESIFHEHEMTRQRIKSAEIRKIQANRFGR